MPEPPPDLAGGSGGQFSDWIAVPIGTTFQFFAGQFVDAIEVNGRRYGGSGGSPSPLFTLDQPLTEITGRSGAYLDGIGISFGNTTSSMYGGNGGAPFRLSRSGRAISHIGLRHGTYIDQISVHYGLTSSQHPLAPSQPVNLSFPDNGDY